LHGRIPVVNFLGNSVATDNDGCIAVNRTDMSMPIDGVYAAGDVTCKNTRQSIFAAAEGSQAAVSSLSYINKKRKSGDK
jgi:thioredoxin reductase (NADPH)